MSGQFTASLPDLQTWAGIQMQRAPDFVIGDNYLRRWWIVPRNRMSNTYLHEINKSDDDRALHDHPWDNISFVIEGSYTEITPEHPGGLLREAASVITRKATDSHRLIIPGGGPVHFPVYYRTDRPRMGLPLPKGLAALERICGEPGRKPFDGRARL